MTPLPTIKQAREARRLINRGRKAMGLPRLRYLDFDNATPDDPKNCLSARNVFAPAGYLVYDENVGRCDCVNCVSSKHFPEALSAMGIGQQDSRYIPDSILDVTDAFDAQVEGLRERLVEAGVVKP